MSILGLLPTREICLVVFLQGIAKILAPDQLYAKYLELDHILVWQKLTVSQADPLTANENYLFFTQGKLSFCSYGLVQHLELLRQLAMVDLLCI